MADTIKISGLPEKTTIAETDFLVGNVGTGTDATGRVEIDALRTRLNIANQTVVGNIAHTGNQVTSGSMKAATFEGNGALLTGIVAAGTGGTSSASSLSLVCSSDGSVLGEKIALSKYSTPLADVDETGFKVRTGIPYTHEDASIPFDKDINQQGNHILQSQTIQDVQPAQYAHGNGSTTSALTSDHASYATLFPGTIRASFNPESIGETNGRIFQKGNTALYLQSVSSGKYKLTLAVDFSTTDGIFIFTDYQAVESEENTVEIAYDPSSVSNVPEVHLNGKNIAITTQTAPVGTYVSDSGSGLYLLNRSAGDRAFDGNLSLFESSNYVHATDYAKALSSNPNKAIDWADEGGSNVAQNVSSTANGVAFPYLTFSGTATGYTVSIVTDTNARALTADEIVVKKGEQWAIDFVRSGESGAEPEFIMARSETGADVTSEGWTASVTGQNRIVFNITEDNTVVAMSRTILASGYTISNLNVHQLGCTLRYKGADMTTGYLFDSSGNGNHAANTDVSIGNASRQLYELASTFTPANGDFGTWTSPTFTAKEKKTGSKVFVSITQTGGTIDPGAAGKYFTGLTYTPSAIATAQATNGAFADLGAVIITTAKRLYFSDDIGPTTTLSLSFTYETNE